MSTTAIPSAAAARPQAGAGRADSTIRRTWRVRRMPRGLRPSHLRHPAPRWTQRERIGFTVLLLVASAVFLVGLTASGYANEFYSAAAQAGSMDWKAFLWGSLDPGNAITVDKPPASIWLMALSVRIFGLSSFAILLPQALMGIATTAVLYLTVRRVWSPAAGAIASVVFLTTPITALMFRFNNPDALLMLLLTSATAAVLRAIDYDTTRTGNRRRTGWMVFAGVLVGLGFLTKQLQAFLILPGLAIAFLVASPTKVGRRIGDGLAAVAAVIVSAGWWVALTLLVPASQRPYIGGSQNNSFLELTFGYNGFGRLTGNETGSVVPGSGSSTPQAGMWGQTGLLRLFGQDFAGQAVWLVFFAFAGIVVGLVLAGKAARTDRHRAGVIAWGSWLVVTWLTFSLMGGIFHAYYTIALVPAIAVLTAVCVTGLWEARRELWAQILAPVLVVATGAFAWHIVLQSGWQTWIGWTALGLSMLGAALMTIAAVGSRRKVVTPVTARSPQMTSVTNPSTATTPVTSPMTAVTDSTVTTVTAQTYPMTPVTSTAPQPTGYVYAQSTLRAHAQAPTASGQAVQSDRTSHIPQGPQSSQIPQPPAMTPVTQATTTTPRWVWPMLLAALVVSGIACLIGPVSWTGVTLSTGHHGSIVSAGPSQNGMGGHGGQGGPGGMNGGPTGQGGQSGFSSQNSQGGMPGANGPNGPSGSNGSNGLNNQNGQPGSNGNSQSVPQGRTGSQNGSGSQSLPQQGQSGQLQGQSGQNGSNSGRNGSNGSTGTGSNGSAGSTTAQSTTGLTKATSALLTLFGLSGNSNSQNSTPNNQQGQSGQNQSNGQSTQQGQTGQPPSGMPGGQNGSTGQNGASGQNGSQNGPSGSGNSNSQNGSGSSGSQNGLPGIGGSSQNGQNGQQGQSGQNGMGGPGAGGPGTMGEGGPGGHGGGSLLGSQSSSKVARLIKKNASKYRWAAATSGSQSAAGYQLSSGVSVMAIGGFNGSDPYPTLGQFQKYVRQSTIHWYIAGNSDGQGQMGGSSATSQIVTWVAKNYTAKTVDGVTLYDLTKPKTA